MSSLNTTWEKDGFIMRQAKESDAESYYSQNYCPLDQEVVRLTGSRKSFTKEEVIAFFLKSVREKDRYFFLIISPDGQIVGESVINEIDWVLRRGNFRICIFRSDARGKGIGTWATRMTCAFAFEHLRLHRLELNVFSFNPRAEKAYLKAGFKKEGILRDAVLDGDRYADEILMAVLEDDWKSRNETK